MPKRARSPAFAAALAAAGLVLTAAPAPGTEHTRLEPVWIDALGSDGTAGHTMPALLSVPPAWTVGDAAVVVLSEGPWPGLARERTVAALLSEGAAVLELDVTAARGFSPDNARTGPPATAEELLPDLRGATEALRRDAGAGLVVALGHGAGGDAAVLAAEIERAAVPPGAAPGLVAAASLGPGPARFALGGAPPGRGWRVRAELLCGVLATEALPLERGAEGECRRALAGQGEAYTVRTAKP